MMRAEPAANDRAASQYWKDAKEKARSTKLLALHVWWARPDSNREPKDYESPAPPLSYRPVLSASPAFAKRAFAALEA